MILILWAKGAESGELGGMMFGNVNAGCGASDSIVATTKSNRECIEMLARFCIMTDSCSDMSTLKSNC